MRRTLEIAREPSGRAYEDLVYRALPFCAAALLVVVPLEGGGEPLLPGGRAVLADLEPSLLSSADEREWPGTRLEPPHAARVLRYTLSPEVVGILARATDRLYGWRPPALPQDLALLRGDGSPFLATVSAESWGALTLDDDERAELCAAVPDLELRELWG